jgi:hypothetical protein
MAKNDAVVLKANFDNWKAERGDGLDCDPWLYYCIEQFVKGFTLDDEEIGSGITDGGNDGGADAIFFLVNQGQLVFYDRRKGFYRDQGKPVSKIVSANELAQAVISVLLQRPADARARPGDYFKDDARYNQIFEGSGLPMSAYLNCYRIVNAVTRHLRAQGVDRGVGNNLKYYAAALVGKSLADMPAPPPEKIASLALVTTIDQRQVDEAVKLARKYYDKLSAKVDGDVVARGTELTRRLNEAFKRKQKAEKKAAGK